MILMMHGCHTDRFIDLNYKSDDDEPSQMKITLWNDDIIILNNIISIDATGEYIVFINNGLQKTKLLKEEVKNISIKEFDLIKFFLNSAMIVGGILLLFYLLFFPLRFS